MGNLKFRTLMLITSKWIMIDIKFDNDRSPLEEQFCVVKIFKMAVTIPQKFNIKQDVARLLRIPHSFICKSHGKQEVDVR